MDKLSQRVSQLFLAEIRDEFLPFLAGKTSVSIVTLNRYWTEFNGQTVEPESSEQPAVKAKTYTQDELEHLKIKDLRDLCGTFKLTKAGVKQQLIDKILAKIGTPNVETRAAPVKVKIPSPVQQPKLDLEKFRAQPVAIAKNENGHWIDANTSIVFSEDEEYIDGVKCRIAIGYEDEDGTVEDLTAELINACNRFNFRYREPANIII